MYKMHSRGELIIWFFFDLVVMGIFGAGALLNKTVGEAYSAIMIGGALIFLFFAVIAAKRLLEQRGK